MAHANARTNLFARRLMVERVAAGWPAVHVAEQLGVSRATATPPSVADHQRADSPPDHNVSGHDI